MTKFLRFSCHALVNSVFLLLHPLSPFLLKLIFLDCFMKKFYFCIFLIIISFLSYNSLNRINVRLCKLRCCDHASALDPFSLLNNKHVLTSYIVSHLLFFDYISLFLSYLSSQCVILLYMCGHEYKNE